MKAVKHFASVVVLSLQGPVTCMPPYIPVSQHVAWGSIREEGVINTVNECSLRLIATSKASCVPTRVSTAFPLVDPRLYLSFAWP